MDLNVGKEVATMKRMTVNELRAKYAEVFGEETKARHKEWLVRRIAWRMQALAEGDLSERARRRAEELCVRKASLKFNGWATGGSEQRCQAKVSVKAPVKAGKE